MSKFYLRPIKEEDDHILKEIYAHTRIEEINMFTDWSEKMKEAFIDHQYNAQKDYYFEIYPNADYKVIIFEGLIAGRLYVERNQIKNNIRIIDIIVLPQFQKNGIATDIITNLMSEVRSKNKILSIHVEKFNKALNLYIKLGFEIVKETNGVYLLMHWKPN